MKDWSHSLGEGRRKKSVQWRVQDFVNGTAFSLFFKERTRSEIRGLSPGKIFSNQLRGNRGRKTVAPPPPETLRRVD